MKKIAILVLAVMLPGCATYAVPVGVVRVEPAPVVVYPQPVYRPVYRPVPIYATTAPVVFYQPPVVYRSPPVVVYPQPVIYGRRYGVYY